MTLQLFEDAKPVLSFGTLKPTRRTGTPIEHVPLVQTYPETESEKVTSTHEVGVRHSVLPVATLRDALATPDLL